MSIQRDAVGGLAATAAILLVVAVLGTLLMQCAECKDRGGVFVRGAIWYECVEAR